MNGYRPIVELMNATAYGMAELSVRWHVRHDGRAVQDAPDGRRCGRHAPNQALGAEHSSPHALAMGIPGLKIYRRYSRRCVWLVQGHDPG